MGKNVTGVCVFICRDTFLCLLTLILFENLFLVLSDYSPFRLVPAVAVIMCRQDNLHLKERNYGMWPRAQFWVNSD